MKGRPKRRVSQIVNVPAPVGGINDYDSIANMPATDALEMINYFPGNGSLVVRDGYGLWADGFAKPVRTLMSYNTRMGTGNLFAATDDGIWDVSSKATIGAAEYSGLTNGRLNYINFANTVNQYLVAVNGVDAAVLYDGTNWTAFTQVGSPVNPGEIDINPILLKNVHAFKNRLWFVERDSMTARYLPTDSVAGEAKPFFLGGVFTRGGYLINIATWSLDSGSGLDDVLVFQSSRGELALYTGNDPDATEGLALSSVYYIGSPLHDRTFTDVGGDLAFLTANGVVPMSKIVGGSQNISSYEETLSKKINRTLNELVNQRGNAPLWEIAFSPEQQSLMIAFPSVNGIAAVQYIMNSVTGAWGSYDLPAKTIQFHDNELFFSDEDLQVWKLGASILDATEMDGSGGSPVITSVMQAHSYLGMIGVSKHFKLVRPIFTSGYMPSYLLKISVDFGPDNVFSVPEPPINSAGLGAWDVAIWDTDIWFPGNQTQLRWEGVSGYGYSAALILKMATNVPTEFVAVDWAFEPGNSL